MKIALVSLNQYWENKEKNLALCQGYITNASQNHVDLIIFPEMTLTGFSMAIASLAENEMNSSTIKKFQSFAKHYGIAIVFGVIIKEKEKASNKSYFINDNGDIIGIYKKIHPFSFAKEDQFFNSGNDLTIIDYKDHKFALTICYDLRFPELYSALSKNSDIIINIANWPEKRVEHWNILLKARAIENQLFLIGVNRIGIDGMGLHYKESSIIFNANGEALEYSLHENMKIFEIDKNYTNEYQTIFNTINDKKRNFYKKVL